ncbi:branched-chain amino acid aminotransferase II [Ramicandelaber brevisporus]|nr:branched-chain amino acid aminotransferase II [Ramicandelaber brevisporus]
MLRSSVARLHATAVAATQRRSLSGLSAAKITREPVVQPKQIPELNTLVFGRTFSDHMLTAEWYSEEATAGSSKVAGWQAPHIGPYRNLSLAPSATVFHYAFECFEGLKAYRGKDGQVRLFRPDMNMKRMNTTAERLTLPMFANEEGVECIKQFVKADERWVPSERGYSLYLRPTLIGTQEMVGVNPPNKALWFVIGSPVGPYYKTGFKAVTLYADPKLVRAWPGGLGGFKAGANYAQGILPQIEAAKHGCQQCLWLFGEDNQLTEVGTMNCFVFWKNEAGEKELITPPLDGMILPGVTRDSILQLARQWGEFKVTEGQVSLGQVERATKEGRLYEMFGAGTACIVSPIKGIKFEGRDIKIPLDPKNPDSQAGPLAKRFNDTLLGIQYGDIEHPSWSVIV